MNKQPKFTWSTRDEQVFQEMQQRRTRWNDVHRSNLRVTLENLIQGPLPELLIEAFVSRAGEIRDALSPFDSGERAPTANEG